MAKKPPKPSKKENRAKEPMIGKAKGTRRFDIALENVQGSGFLALLIGLMSFLVILALSASFALSAMSDRWSSGLENKMTIEIPAEDLNGAPRSRENITRLTGDITAAFDNMPQVKSYKVLSEEDISELVKPWLGENLPLQDIPLPGLISVETHNNDAANIQALERRLKNISGNIRLDTHQNWLSHLLRFTQTLQLVTFLISLVVGVTTIIAIIGAVKARMSVLHDEIELLHLIGATDNYIASQFQRYSFFISLKGSLIGTLVSAIILSLIGLLFSEMSVNLLPNFKLTMNHIVIIGFVPIVISLCAMITARRTVIHALTQLP